MSDSPNQILVVNDHGVTYARPFRHLPYKITRDHSAIFDSPEKVALVVFTGGEDVSPTLYNAESVHHSTRYSLKRDEEELKIFNKADDWGIPKAGICRGAQFLCVAAGGTLAQNITGHTVNHSLVAKCPFDGDKRKEFKVTSSHHQMQHLGSLTEGEDYELLAYPPEQKSQFYDLSAQQRVQADRACTELKMEPDVVWYPKIKALAAQYHPEWMAPDSDGFLYFRDLVEHYLVPLMEGLTPNDEKRAGAN